MLTRIKNYNTNDVVNSIKYLLGKSTESPEVRILAIEITSHAEDKISAIYAWMKQNFSYISDPVSAELFISPVRQVNEFRAGLPIGGDCDDSALMATALLHSIGIQSNVVLIDQIGNGLDHAYSRAFSEKIGWVNFDVTKSNYPLGWEPKLILKTIIV